MTREQLSFWYYECIPYDSRRDEREFAKKAQWSNRAGGIYDGGKYELCNLLLLCNAYRV